MKLKGKSKIVEKKSKFYGYFFEIDHFSDIEDVVEFVKKEHQKARHVCYGAIFEVEEIFKNDSEVGNPGKGLLQILKQKEISNSVLIVARYFGGVKLGPAGVLRSFRDAGKKAIENSAKQ